MRGQFIHHLKNLLKNQLSLAVNRDDGSGKHKGTTPQHSLKADCVTIEQLQTEYPDVPIADLQIVVEVFAFTMTSVERLIALVSSVDYINSNEIPGAFAECGVWKGGSVMAMIKVLLRAGTKDRDIFLYDTFEGMSTPTDVDISYAGEVAVDIYNSSIDTETASSSWCLATLEEIREQIAQMGYPEEKIHYVPGRVEETIPETAPDTIALLRLDTDWFESTAHELEHLFPRLSPSGVLIIDDYGYWQGARKAVDQYFGRLSAPPLLQRIDSTGRLCIKGHE